MVYYITQKRLGVQNAAGKAPVDIYTLCEQRGWKELFYPGIDNWKHTLYFRIRRALAVTQFWIAASCRLKKEDVVFYQHPASYGSKIAYRFVRFLHSRNVKFVMLIHDLNSLRFQLLFSDPKKTNVLFEDGPFLKQFDVIICHNEHMKDYLVSQGVPSEKLICLELFDYLLPAAVVPSEISSNSVVIAGNLLPKKSGYIYELGNLDSDWQIHLYGINYCEDMNQKGIIHYHGSYSPDKLPSALKGNYGIVWDGNSIDTCEGSSGNYLRYNNPHKLSLYMAAGIPVITWKQAAIADFVKEYEVGIVLESLRELPEALAKITEEQYGQMRSNISPIQQQVITGYFFNRAIETALAKIQHQSKRKMT